MIKTHFPGSDYIGNVESFFHFDPLLALATFLASKVIFLSFILAAITITVTFILGRVACGWVCPLGSIHQFFSFLFKKAKLLRPKKLKSNHLAWKYYLLAFILISAVFTLDIVGLFDPFSLLYRSFSTGLFPVLNTALSSFISLLYSVNLSAFGDSLIQFSANLDINSTFNQGFFIGILFIGIVLLNLHRERYWCRYLCPLGALLGIISRWNIIKLKVSSDKCIECNLCTIHCQTQADPFPEEEWKSSECVYCFTCSAICPTSAISLPFSAKPEKIESVNLSRRKLIFSSVLGAIAVPFFRISPSTQRASDKLIRPPGSVREDRFLQKCVKCGECMKVCPTNAIQPALTEAGPEGLWTPMLVPKIGYCEYYCSLCTQVCPTGAIQEFSIEEKNRIKIGTAWVNRNRCIPWKFGNPCIVCEEHCPVSPKAIKFIQSDVTLPDGTIRSAQAPVIDLETCTGCGICENKCPVVDDPAIYVTSVGESRSERNQMLLDIIQPEEDLF
jgi:polyferredoxin